MEYKCLFVEKEGHVATVTLNRPGSGNAFDFRLMEEIDHVFRDNLDKDDDVRAIILTGAGKYFSTGVDLNIFAAAEPEVSDEELEQGVGSSRVPTAEEDVPWGKGTIVGAVVTMTTSSRAYTVPTNHSGSSVSGTSVANRTASVISIGLRIIINSRLLFQAGRRSPSGLGA